MLPSDGADYRYSPWPTLTGQALDTHPLAPSDEGAVNEVDWGREPGSVFPQRRKNLAAILSLRPFGPPPSSEGGLRFCFPGTSPWPPLTRGLAAQLTGGENIPSPETGGKCRRLTIDTGNTIIKKISGKQVRFLRESVAVRCAKPFSYTKAAISWKGHWEYREGENEASSRNIRYENPAARDCGTGLRGIQKSIFLCKEK